ncbi:death-on-curing protein [Bordetella genomosp. 7]|uniref:Death-on-curing protein n=1 Tax=Bordetella genomosp. 7 TaxID=1416805 RepID=A0A261QYY3_9BORD|nr:type II toxin-antitoxin system death-on-curing family toxin [Bordetella genomosp. 7]OZI17998.1 death-on-curing protein [Bordetella genomosp. 7]OZI21792.1 death-on-curing protein [Bordetella genomosp. 7]
MLDPQFVIAVHDEIIAELGGLPGLAGGGAGAVEAALFRVEMHAQYAELNDVFGIAGLYAEAIARGHVFNDANKRTALTCALTYLYGQGIEVPRSPELEEVMVHLAAGNLSGEDVADFLYAVWIDHGQPAVGNAAN